jgi:cyclase
MKKIHRTMLAKRIIPCLDVKDGRVVKGVNFESLKDAGSILEQAKFYNTELADEIIFLDISASIESRHTLLSEVRKVSEEVFIPLTVGGGISDVETAKQAFRNGADKVAINTSAVKTPTLISELAERFGSQAVVVAIDVKKVGDHYEVFTHSGKNPTGKRAVDWANEVVGLGAGEILLTSMDRDGTRDGYDLESLKQISTSVSVPVIASGGAGKLQHLTDAFVFGFADAVLAASIFHYREYSIIEAKRYLQSKGIEVRL